ncbi:MAG: PaaI family thioesterase [SAR202 cluster bacterium]|nr:PaaI family thioesterase [SAR202 cluster bacterium]
MLPLNDDTDYGLCFACGPRNETGMRLRFEVEGDRILTRYTARPEHQGFPGYLHGGVISALLDEVMSRVSLLEGKWTMTAKMEVRFRKPVLIGQEVTAVGKLAEKGRGLVKTEGSAVLPDGTIAAQATATFVFVAEETLARMSAGYPGLASTWMKQE